MYCWHYILSPRLNFLRNTPASTPPTDPHWDYWGKAHHCALHIQLGWQHWGSWRGGLSRSWWQRRVHLGPCRSSSYPGTNCHLCGRLQVWLITSSVYQNFYSLLCALRISGYPYYLISAVTHFDVILQEGPHRVSQEVAGEAAGGECASSGLPHICWQALRWTHDWRWEASPGEEHEVQTRRGTICKCLQINLWIAS